MKERLMAFWEEFVFMHELDEDTELEVRTGVKIEAIISAILIIEMIILLMSR